MPLNPSGGKIPQTSPAAVTATPRSDTTPSASGSGSPPPPARPRASPDMSWAMSPSGAVILEVEGLELTHPPEGDPGETSAHGVERRALLTGSAEAYGSLWLREFMKTDPMEKNLNDVAETLMRTR